MNNRFERCIRSDTDGNVAACAERGNRSTSLFLEVLLPAPTKLASSATLAATNVSRALGERTILSNVSVTVSADTRLGVIGPNGVGKSSLLRLLAKLDQPDSGVVEVSPRTAVVGYLAQEPDRSEAEDVLGYLYRTTGVAPAEAALQSAAEALTLDERGAIDTYADALEHWEAIGAADLDARIARVIKELGLPKRILELSMAALSGGQAARVALAAILLSRFDVLLLDEPTNDLDFDGLSRLEQFVSGYRGGLVIVSHDREFLDRAITSVLELDEHDHTARLYRGGWSSYLDERATARRHAEEHFANYRTERQTLLERARREREWATQGVARDKRRPRDNDKAQRDFHLNRTEKLASRARRTDNAIARLESVEKPWGGWELHFTINEAPRSGAVVVRLEHAVAERGSFRLGPIDLEIAWGERVALLGPNGSGKTTLLQAMLGRIPLTSGERWMGPSVVVGELGQDRQAFMAKSTMLESFLSSTDLDTAAARSLLAKFGLGADQVSRATSTLSPGERTRAELAAFQSRGVNTLVLDEPTNHLDLPAIEQLEEALAGYDGTLLLVTHDRRLLEAVDVSRTIDLAS
jgi:ATPase subunit of ABC transporter with duplicated ATPase domains